MRTSLPPRSSAVSAMSTLVLRSHVAMAITTARLQLDPLAPLDLEPFADLHASTEVTRYLSPARPLTHSESFRLFCQVLGHAQVRGFGYWAVRRRSDARWLGVVGLWFPEGWPGVELGWRFGADFWGQGYAEEASRAVLDFAHRELQHRELLSIIHCDNHRSLRLAEKLGMLPWKALDMAGVPASILRWIAPHDAERTGPPAP